MTMSRMTTYAQQANNSGNKDAISSNSGTNNSDYSKKEEFRKYLEQTGVLDALTKVLVGLYEEPERPQHAVEYIKKYIGAPPNVDVEGLKRENEQLKAELEQLKRQYGISGTNAKPGKNDATNGLS